MIKRSCILNVGTVSYHFKGETFRAARDYKLTTVIFHTTAPATTFTERDIEWTNSLMIIY